MDLIWVAEHELVIAGPDTGPRGVQLPAGRRSSGIRIRPGAAGAVLGRPACEIRNCQVDAALWLLSQQHSLAQLAQAMVALADSGTLAQLYQRLTGQPSAQAWPAFHAAIQALPGPVSADDPFDALTSIGGSPTTPGISHRTRP